MDAYVSYSKPINKKNGVHVGTPYIYFRLYY
jgi:hypothetical protein